MLQFEIRDYYMADIAHKLWLVSFLVCNLQYQPCTWSIRGIYRPWQLSVLFIVIYCHVPDLMRLQLAAVMQQICQMSDKPPVAKWLTGKTK